MTWFLGRNPLICHNSIGEEASITSRILRAGKFYNSSSASKDRNRASVSDSGELRGHIRQGAELAPDWLRSGRAHRLLRRNVRFARIGDRV